MPSSRSRQMVASRTVPGVSLAEGVCILSLSLLVPRRRFLWESPGIHCFQNGMSIEMWRLKDAAYTPAIEHVDTVADQRQFARVGRGEYLDSSLRGKVAHQVIDFRSC